MLNAPIIPAFTQVFWLWCNLLEIELDALFIEVRRQ
jgi:hypothetical protein